MKFTLEELEIIKEIKDALRKINDGDISGEKPLLERHKHRFSRLKKEAIILQAYSEFAEEIFKED